MGKGLVFFATARSSCWASQDTLAILDRIFDVPPRLYQLFTYSMQLHLTRTVILFFSSAVSAVPCTEYACPVSMTAEITRQGAVLPLPRGPVTTRYKAGASLAERFGLRDYADVL